MWNHLYMMLAHLDFTLTLMLAAIWYQVCDWKQIGSEKERDEDLWTSSTGCLACMLYIWLGISLRFILIAFSPASCIVEYSFVHREFKSCLYFILCVPCIRSAVLLCCSVSHISNANPKDDDDTAMKPTCERFFM